MAAMRMGGLMPSRAGSVNDDGFGRVERRACSGANPPKRRPPELAI
jgi:hypothetical protein